VVPSIPSKGLFVFIRVYSWLAKNPNFQRNTAPDFLLYLSEDQNQRRPKQEGKSAT
jgi:hypothetical protein